MTQIAASIILLSLAYAGLLILVGKSQRYGASDLHLFVLLVTAAGVVAVFVPGIAGDLWHGNVFPLSPLVSWSVSLAGLLLMSRWLLPMARVAQLPPLASGRRWYRVELPQVAMYTNRTPA